MRPGLMWKYQELKRKKERKKDRLWHRLCTDAAKRDYWIVRNNENRLLICRKHEYYRRKTEEAGSNVNEFIRYQII